MLEIMPLSFKRIEELSLGNNVKKIAVLNFLSTLGNMTQQEAMGNLEYDAFLYRWNDETKAAIWTGILEHFKK